ncbi:MAG: hypothetical protein L0287_13470, partial [Anaerolineae bacterium]|nr:hypothetical protein [Anaerolineae bacterium]
MPGSFNPKDSARTTTTRPTHVDPGSGARRWNSDELGTVPAAQDLNRVIANFYEALDYYAVTDDPSNGDRMLRNLLIAAAPPRSNFVGNPSFDVWQVGTSFNNPGDAWIADL